MSNTNISDNDPIFISKLWQKIFKLSGTQLYLKSAYHPQSDGQLEVVNSYLEQYLCCYVHQWLTKWSSYLL